VRHFADSQTYLSLWEKSQELRKQLKRVRGYDVNEARIPSPGCRADAHPLTRLSR
jgi:hypothetical protein